MEFNQSPPETRRSFAFLMKLMANPRVSMLERVAMARSSGSALDQHVEVRFLFPDLEVALELRNCKHRAHELACAKDSEAHFGPFTQAHQDELERMSERIREIPKSIRCAEWYGEHDRDRDRKLVEELEGKRNKTPLTETENNEKARAVAQIAAFRYQQSQTPEGKARARLFELTTRFKLSPEERAEREALESRFPRTDAPSPIVQKLQAFMEKYKAELADSNRKDG